VHHDLLLALVRSFASRDRAPLGWSGDGELLESIFTATPKFVNDQ